MISALKWISHVSRHSSCIDPAALALWIHRPVYWPDIVPLHTLQSWWWQLISLLLRYLGRSKWFCCKNELSKYLALQFITQENHRTEILTHRILNRLWRPDMPHSVRLILFLFHSPYSCRFPHRISLVAIALKKDHVKCVKYYFIRSNRTSGYSRHRSAAHSATTDASNMPPSKSRHVTSQYSIQTNFSLEMHSCFGSIHLEFLIKSSTIALSTCASSFVMPGRNFGEHNGVKSMFGTIYPFSGSVTVGWANSCGKNDSFIIPLVWLSFGA